MIQLLRPEQAAARLNVSPLTFRKWIHQGRVPVVRVGRCVRIREQDLEAMIRFGSFSPNQDGTNNK